MAYCFCGHADEEHVVVGLKDPCGAHGCDCADYEHDPEADD